jgi:linoleate 10R-lipoxygenase
MISFIFQQRIFSDSCGVSQLEKVLTLMARLGDDSEFSSRLQQVVIDIRECLPPSPEWFISSQRFHLVYTDLPHPPAAYLALPSSNRPIVSTNQIGGYPVTYAYRPADGSNYNPLVPTIGMAGSPYARTVPSIRRLSPAALPPAELVFDKLLKQDKFVEHPGGISSLFFAFADLIIHNVFNTDHRSPGYTINQASSYLDLSPLYGTSQQAVNHVRLHDGTGRLKPDVFADPRLLNMPPAVCALLVIFNRNHNVSPPSILYIRCAPASMSFEVCGGKNPFHQRVREIQVSSARSGYS